MTDDIRKGKGGKRMVVNIGRQPLCSLFLDIDETDASLLPVVGRKCAFLGELRKIGFEVPEGFFISIPVYERFLRETGLEDKIIKCACEAEKEGLNVEKCEELAKKLRALIENEEMPEWIRSEIEARYEKMCSKFGGKEIPVAVRSAGVESRPGMFETYLNVVGKAEVVENVKKVWSSQFTARAIAFRKNKGLPITADPLGVAVIRMIDAIASGICFTMDPVAGETSKIIIEANWGLGEGVVSGGESVDTYVVDKSKLCILDRTIRKKEKMVRRVQDGGVEWVEVPESKAETSCLTDSQVIEIAEKALRIEEKMGMPQDIEWAIDSESKVVYFLQTRAAKALTLSPSEQIARRMGSLHREIKIKSEALKEIQFKF